MKKSVRMPQLKAGMSKAEPRMASMYDCSEETIQKMGMTEERKLMERDLLTGNGLEGECLLCEE